MKGVTCSSFIAQTHSQTHSQTHTHTFSLSFTLSHSLFHSCTSIHFGACIIIMYWWWFEPDPLSTFSMIWIHKQEHPKMTTTVIRCEEFIYQKIFLQIVNEIFYEDLDQRKSSNMNKIEYWEQNFLNTIKFCFITNIMGPSMFVFHSYEPITWILTWTFV